jgi:hypothetical protein
MIKHTKFFITFLLTVIALAVNAQSTQSTQSTATTSSPYSRYGLGDIIPTLLPQNLAMGGIGTALNRISGYNNINPLNPASYGVINFTTIDAGIYNNNTFLSQTGQTGNPTSNFRLSHIAFAVPVSKHSAFSFGLLPYSQLGYNYKQTSKNFGTTSSTDTNAVNYLYSGEGGLSKAYLGYGFGLGRHLLLGANMSYIFGNLIQNSATEVPALFGVLNSNIEQSNSITGLNYDLGIQYSFDFSESRHLTLGYSVSTGSTLNSSSNYVVTQYSYDASGNKNIASDTLINNQNVSSKIKLPQINHFGISYQYDQRYIIGADYTMGQWSSLTIGGTNGGLQDSKTFNFGGQFTPNVNALHSYFNRVDYRFGVLYDNTYLKVNNTNITRYALTFGLGLPLAPNNTSFYKINFSAEVGKRGTLDNGLVKENYVNLHLAFTLNDKWFQRFRFQ